MFVVLILVVLSGFIFANSDIQIADKPDWFVREAGGNLRSLALDRSGERIISTADDGTARILDFRTGQELVKLAAGDANDEILNAEFSPDGSKVMTTAFLGWQARVWNSRTGKLIREFKFDRNVRYSTFSPDGKNVAIAVNDGRVVVFDLSRNIVLFKLHHDAVAKSVTYSPDGKKILVAASDKTAYLWDTQTQKLIWRFRGHKDYVNLARFSQDGQKALTVSDDKSVGIWDIKSGKSILFLRNFTEDITDAVFNFDGKSVITSSYDDKINFWELKQGRSFKQFKFPKISVVSLAISKDGTELVGSCTDSYIRIWKMDSGQEVRGFARHDEGIRSIIMSPNGQKFISTTVSGKSMVRTLDGKVFFDLSDQKNSVWFANFSLNGKYIVTMGGNAIVKVWNAETGDLIGRVGKDTRDGGQFEYPWDTLADPTFSADGQQIAVTSPDGKVRLWSVQDQKLLFEFTFKKDRMRSLIFSPDGKYLVGQTDKYALVWDTQTGERLYHIENRILPTPMIFDPTSTKLLVFYSIFDLKTGVGVRLEKRTPKLDQEGNPAEVINAHLSPDGQKIVLLFNSGSVGTWDLNGKLLAKNDPFGDTIILWNSVFVDKKNFLITQGKDGSVNVWNIEDWSEVQRFSSQKSTVSAIAVTPDGQYAITGSGDGIRRWKLLDK
jgi:WD40 repeat protein